MDTFTRAARRGPAAQIAATPVTWAILALNVAAFLWVEAHGSTLDTATLLEYGALARRPVWGGEWWRLLTAAFLHIGLLHLGANMFFGVPWCRQLELVLRPGRFAALYLASAIGASALSLLGQDQVSAGASGALFGVIGATLALQRRALGSWNAFLANPGTRLVLGNLAALTLAGFVLPLDQFAHGGGFVTGAAIGWIASRPAPRRASAWAAPAAALLLITAAAIRPDARWVEDRDAFEAIHEALTAGESDRALALVAELRTRGLGGAALDYYDGVARAQTGDLEGGLERLRPLADGAGGPVREEAQRARAAVAKQLGVRHALGEGRPRDPAEARRLLGEACQAGDTEACALAEQVVDADAP